MRISAELRTFPLLGSGRRHAAGIPSSLTAVNNPPSFSTPSDSFSPSSYFSAFQPFSYLQQGLRRYFSCNFRIVPPIHLHQAAFPRLRARDASSPPRRSQNVLRNTDRKHHQRRHNTSATAKNKGKRRNRRRIRRRTNKVKKEIGKVEVEGNGGAGNLGQRVSTLACLPLRRNIGYWASVLTKALSLGNTRREQVQDLQAHCRPSEALRRWPKYAVERVISGMG